MTKKKRNQPTLEDMLERPWCYYCERDFDDLKILIQHQKAKHFKCDRCNRRLNTAGGLSVHLMQTHKETLTLIENALPTRGRPDIEIFGIHGIPEDIQQAHNQNVTREFYANEATRRAHTGNVNPGTAQQNGPSKKPKLETPEEIKRRLAEHKARKLADQTGGGSVTTPITASATPAIDSPVVSIASPREPFQGSAGVSNAPPGASGSFVAPSFAPLQASQAQAYAPRPSITPIATHPYGQQQQLGSAISPFSHVPSPAAISSHTPYMPPPGMLQPHAMPQPYSMPSVSGPPMHFNTAPPMHSPAPFHAHPPHNVQGIKPPVSSFAQAHPPVRPSSTEQAHPMAPRQTSLPVVPGLPQRPTFDAPPVSRAQLNDMHHGQQNVTQYAHGPGPGPGFAMPPSVSPISAQQHAPFPMPNHGRPGVDAHAASGNAHQAMTPSLPPAAAHTFQPAQVSALPMLAAPIHSAHAQPAPLAFPTPSSTPAMPVAVPVPTTMSAQPTAVQTTSTTPVAGKKGKQNIRLTVTDHLVSPEEKMARMSRYSFVPRKKVAAA